MVYLFDLLHLGWYLKLLEFILVFIDTNSEFTSRSERKEAANNTLSAYQAVQGKREQDYINWATNVAVGLGVGCLRIQASGLLVVAPPALK
ncbi:uncharacterized protein [Spinacia oleracea]|uniref:Uncharacterized protein isoform X2 n=1 Tax=Spinacia oleracea TaxID=3562 RepID=A0ABM3R3K0_SPIOL|nr:uncharacterized protein LOC110779741 isoform X2 [Spinacia oleracea]